MSGTSEGFKMIIIVHLEDFINDMIGREESNFEQFYCYCGRWPSKKEHHFYYLV